MELRNALVASENREECQQVYFPQVKGYVHLNSIPQFINRDAFISYKYLTNLRDLDNEITKDDFAPNIFYENDSFINKLLASYSYGESSYTSIAVRQIIAIEKVINYIEDSSLHNTLVYSSRSLRSVKSFSEVFACNKTLPYGTSNNMVSGYAFGNIRVNKGFIGELKESSIVPLAMVVLKESYVKDFKIACLLDTPIDYSQIEIWLNPSIDFLSDTSRKVVINTIKGSNSAGHIKICVKDNLTNYYAETLLPTTYTISDRVKVLETIKNTYLNHMYEDLDLPVVELDYQNVVVDTIKYKFKSRILNTFVNSYNDPTKISPITLNNKYELI